MSRWRNDVLHGNHLAMTNYGPSAGKTFKALQEVINTAFLTVSALFREIFKSKVDLHLYCADVNPSELRCRLIDMNSSCRTGANLRYPHVFVRMIFNQIISRLAGPRRAP